VTWRVEFLPAAQRQFDALEKPVSTRIARSLERLRAIRCRHRMCAR